MSGEVSKGDHVILTVENRPYVGVVLLCGIEARSLVVEIDGAVAMKGGFALGILPLLKKDDGKYYELVTNVQIGVERVTKS